MTEYPTCPRCGGSWSDVAHRPAVKCTNYDSCKTFLFNYSTPCHGIQIPGQLLQSAVTILGPFYVQWIGNQCWIGSAADIKLTATGIHWARYQVNNPIPALPFDIDQERLELLVTFS